VHFPGLSVDLDGDVPVYRQIADWVRAAADDGRLTSGRQLPPTRDLARQLGINRNTVVAAYDYLASQGFVHSQTGRGTFLKAPPGAPDVESAGPEAENWFSGFSRAVDAAGTGGMQSIYPLAISTEGISFVGSYPSPALMPVEAMGRAISTALKQSGATLFSYGPTAGYPPLRQAIASRMREQGSAADAGQVMITNGAQQGLELVFRSFLDPGDVVVIEEPTYTGALSVAAALGARVVGLPLDEEGIRPDLLEIALERHRPKLLYVQPTFHNPTSRVMSEARRRRLLALARRYRCPVVEDDWAGDLRFEGQPLPSLHAIDGGRHVIYLGTFSKSLMPGLRVGWVAAPPAVIEKLVGLKRIQDCGTSPLLQAGLQLFVEGGGLEKHLERVRPAYRRQRDCMIEALQRYFPSDVGWTHPSGGLFLWVTLPAGFDGHELFVAARQQGVIYSKGELFHSDGSGHNALRLTYSSATPEQIESGVKKLGTLVRERLERSEPTRERTIESMPFL